MAAGIDEGLADDGLWREAQAAGPRLIDQDIVTFIGRIADKGHPLETVVGARIRQHPPRHKLDAVDAREIRIDAQLVQHDHLRLARQPHIGHALALVQGRHVRQADTQDAGIAAQPLQEAFLAPQGHLSAFHDHNIVVAEAHVHVARIVDLAEHHQGCDAKSDRDRELRHHQDGAQAPRSALPRTVGTQHICGTEARLHQRRIAAADQPGGDGNTQDQQQQRPLTQIMEFHGLAQESAECRQQDFHQRQRQHQCKHGHQHGFAQELHDQLPPCRAQGLAQGDLARPQGDLRRGQIHEVEAGDQQDQHADRADAVDGGPASRRRGIVAPLFGMQMHGREGRQMNRIEIMRLAVQT